MANKTPSVRKPKVVSKRKNITLYTFRDEKEMHFFELFIHYTPNAPVVSKKNHWPTMVVEVQFEPSVPVTVREFKVTLKALERTIEHAFPHFLTRSDKI